MASTLLHYWDFNEAAGPFVSRKNANTATVVGTVTPNTAGFGNLGTQLTIGADGKLLLTTPLTFAGVFAISMWIEIDDVSAADVTLLGTAGTDYVKIAGSGTRLDVNIANVGEASVILDTALGDAALYHVVIRRNSSNNIEVWINNTLNTDSLVYAGTLAIAHIHGTSTLPGMVDGGKLNDFRIYTTELSDDNVEALYEMGVPPTPIKLQDLRESVVRDVTDNDAEDQVWNFNEDFEDDWDSGVTLATAYLDIDADHIMYSDDGITQNRGFIRDTNETSTSTNFRQDFTAVEDLVVDGGDVANLYDLKQGVLEMYFPPGTLVDRTDRDNILGDASAAAKPFLRQLYAIFYPAGFATNTTFAGGLASPNQDKIEGFKSIPIVLGNGDMTNPGTILDAVKRILIQIQWNTAKSSRKRVVFNRLRFKDPPAKARLSFRFDDGFENHRDRADYAASVGVKVAFAIITDLIDTAGRLTSADLAQMYADEMALCNHCEGITGTDAGTLGGWVWPDSNHFEYNTMANRITAVVAARDQLIAWGYPDFAKLLITPGGFPNPGNKSMESDEQLVAQGHLGAIWYGGSGNSAWYGNEKRVEPRGEHNWTIRGAYNMDGETPTQIRAKIDELETSRGVASFFAHNGTQSGGDFSQDTWENILDYALTKSSTLEVVGPDSFFLPNTPVVGASRMSSSLGISLS